MEKLKEQKKEEPKLPKRVFVEIGTRDFPISWVGNKKFGKNDIYAGLDLNESHLREGRENTDSADKLQKNIYFIRADAATLPFENETTDEIFFGNVFGDPSISIQKKETFLEEAKRILKNGGNIIIKETNTPFPENSMIKLAEKHGIAIKKMVRKSSPDWKEEVDKYDKVAGELDFAAYDSYLVEFALK